MAKDRLSWSEEDKAAMRAYLKEYARANPDKFRAYRAARRAAKRANGGKHTADDIAEIRRLQRDRCANPSCRVPLRGRGAVDHITALAKGGSNARSNLQLLCVPCNSRKHAKDPLDFLREEGFLI